jgi:Chalcone isomerase-like
MRPVTTTRTTRGVLAIALTSLALLAHANEPVRTPVPKMVAAEVPALQKLGEGRLRFFGLHVYDSTLYTTTRPFDPAGAFALELRYKMNLKGKAIAERSVAEMRKVGYRDEQQFARWLATMEKLFPDINKGDRLVGVNVLRDGKVVGARFFHNDRDLGLTDDPAFARAFFDIWLSPKTSEPGLRQALLGQPE